MTKTSAQVIERAEANAIARASAYVLALRAAMLGDRMTCIARLPFGDMGIEIARDAGTLWVLIRRPDRGGVALRAVHVPDGVLAARRIATGEGELIRLEVTSDIGCHVVALATSEEDLHRVRLTVTLTSAAPLLVPFTPRDLYVLGADGDPLNARGRVEAAQRGVNTGLLYLRFDEPDFGSLLYLQNLTALNDWVRATDAVPDAAVGGNGRSSAICPPRPRKAAPRRPILCPRAWR